jgi:selenocysteine lyase/cysteine desulfurase
VSPTECRSRFQVPDGVYLLNHSVGALPAAAADRSAHFFELWARKGGGAWDSWLESVDAFCTTLAKLLGSQGSCFCPQVNVSSAVAKLLPALPRRSGRRRILISEHDFPSIGFAVSQAERLGYEITFLSPDDAGCFSRERWEEALTDDVQLVLVTHALHGSGRLNQAREVIDLARAQSIFSLLDVAQSAGVVPIDLDAWNADFVVGSSIKWLCGGPGAAFLWIHPAVLERLRPTDVGWFSHLDPFELDIRHFDYATNARRFWGGTPSILPYAIATAGMEELLRIGVHDIRAHNLKLTGRLAAGARARGLTIVTPEEAEDRGGTLVIAFADSSETVKHLSAQGIHCDYRAGYGVRLSPHVYNTEAEIDAVLRHLPER